MFCDDCGVEMKSILGFFVLNSKVLACFASSSRQPPPRPLLNLISNSTAKNTRMCAEVRAESTHSKGFTLDEASREQQ